jgi:HEPN domain-containing protein
MVERSADWIKQAKRNLENAEYELRGGFYEWSCFLSQQASEKAVKAVFQRLRAEAFGRSVAGLLQRLPEGLAPEKGVIDMAKELDRVYIPTRYPNVHPEGAPYEAYTEGDARRLIEFARRIVEYCEGLLSRI